MCELSLKILTLTTILCCTSLVFYQFGLTKCELTKIPDKQAASRQMNDTNKSMATTKDNSVVTTKPLPMLYQRHSRTMKTRTKNKMMTSNPAMRITNVRDKDLHQGYIKKTQGQSRNKTKTKTKTSHLTRRTTTLMTRTKMILRL